MLRQPVVRARAPVAATVWTEVQSSAEASRSAGFGTSARPSVVVVLDGCGHGPQDRTRSYSRSGMAGVARQERAWVRDAQAGSASAIEALFRAYWPQSYRAAYLVTHDSAAAEDITQEAFLAAIRRLETFDRRRPFGPWLHRIVVNRAIDSVRARQLRGEAELGEAVAPQRSAEVSDGTVAALACLTPEHRAVIVLRYLLGYTPGEIAGLLNLPRGTVNSRLRRGLDTLKERLPS